MGLEDAVYLALFKYTKSLSVALGYRDSLTRIHSERVRGLSETLGIRCGLSAMELGILKISASFHDIGKIGIPDQILLNPAPLGQAELAQMRRHPEIGEKILISTDLEGAQQAALVIRHHHEFFNGLGYPDGLSGEGIPIAARIVSIADSYDAMAMTRSYHRAKKHGEIMEILREETGQKHDPDLMRLFCALIESSHFKAQET